MKVILHQELWREIKAIGLNFNGLPNILIKHWGWDARPSFCVFWCLKSVLWHCNQSIAANPSDFCKNFQNFNTIFCFSAQKIKIQTKEWRSEVFEEITEAFFSSSKLAALAILNLATYKTTFAMYCLEFSA